MKTFALPLLIILFACQQPDFEPVFIVGLDNAPLLVCEEHSAIDIPGTASELVNVGDTALAALFPDARAVLLLDQRLNVIQRVQFDKEGPRRVADPSSIAVHDSTIYMADAKGQKIIAFNWRGDIHAGQTTDFVPLQLAWWGDELAIAPAIMGRYPGTLLFTMRGGQLTRREVSVLDFPDLNTKTLANRVRMAPTPDGLAIIHQFLTPRALLWRQGQAAAIQVPLAAGVRGAVGYRPPLPLNEEALRPALVVANDVAVGSGDELLLLTRTGATRGAQFEKAIMVTGPDLKYRTAYRLPVNAGVLGYFKASRRVVVVDDESRWSTCPLPA